uniref:lytic transglycosylase domain-containing protein n=1 Tax=Gordonia sp. B7-2 TaxID=3420932 RepID=UPI003D8F2F0B
MGKHSKPRKARAPFVAAALVPVGILAAAATAGADPTPHAAPQTEAAHAAADPHTVALANHHVTGPSARQTADPAPRIPAIVPARPVSVTDGAVPASNYDAYRNAADIMSHTTPRCGIDWKVIAGIGKVESHHADEGNVDARGTLREPIFGPMLNGTLAGNQVVTDTDHGALDGDASYDRAVGPMQFLPQTWNHYAADANGDGKIDPQNIFDAALTTARYLCDGNLNLRDNASLVTAVLRYNNSMTYVDDVLGFARSY